MAGSPGEDASLLLRLEHAVDDLLASHREPDRALPGILEASVRRSAGPSRRCGCGGGTVSTRWRAGAPSDTAGSDRFHEFVEYGGQFTFAPGEGLPGQVWVARRALWIDDVDDPAHFPRAPIAQRIGLRSALAFPIGDAHDGDPEGVVELFKDSRLDPDPTLLATLASLGHRLGAHIARARAAALARYGEALFRATVESALDAVVVVGSDGLILEFNPAASDIFGWAREEAVGRDLAELIVPPSLRAEHRQAWSRHLETGERTILGTRIETVGLRRDGTEMPVELTITEAMVDGRRTFTGHLRDLTDRKAVERELLASGRRVVSAGDEARRRIERNLHDGVQQRMVGLALLLGRARSALPADPTHAMELLDHAVSEISETADELRRLARGIHPAGLTRYGLAAALTDLARRSGPAVSVGDAPRGQVRRDRRGDGVLRGRRGGHQRTQARGRRPGGDPRCGPRRHSRRARRRRRTWRRRGGGSRVERVRTRRASRPGQRRGRHAPHQKRFRDRHRGRRAAAPDGAARVTALGAGAVVVLAPPTPWCPQHPPRQTTDGYWPDKGGRQLSSIYEQLRGTPGRRRARRPAGRTAPARSTPRRSVRGRRPGGFRPSPARARQVAAGRRGQLPRTSVCATYTPASTSRSVTSTRSWTTSSTPCPRWRHHRT